MNLRSGLLTGAVLLGLAVPASAVELAGTINISGSVTVTATSITWLPDNLVVVDGINTGTTSIGFPATGYFADPGNGGPSIYIPQSGGGGPVTANQKDIASVPTGGYATVVPGANVAVFNYLSGFADSNPTAPNTFNAEYADLTFELTKVLVPTPVLGACNPITVYQVGESCQLGAFLVTQNASSITIGLFLEGIFRDPSLGLTSLTALGTYSTQSILTNVNTITELGNLLATGGSVSATYSANFIVPAAPTGVPEPATLLTFGAGSAILARMRRRKKA